MTSSMVGEEMGLSTVMMIILFGTNLMLFGVFWYLDRQSSNKPAQEENKGHKVMSKPFKATFECNYNLSKELVVTGGIMALTFVCERYPYFEHSMKHYDRDLFGFIVLLFFIYAWYTRKPTKDLSLLSRDQTEEWKGWMQFIFLLYHYFHAEEVYNSVRCMITCYVWMTGFGNFSFFYFKQDYGWLRVVQMLWRLNFSVMLLMFWHGNTYILYYICPLHTFYFLLTYCIMAIGKQYNHDKWGMRVKIFAAVVLIYLLWDVNGGVFDYVFGFLGTSPVIGANSGTVWEWYFRTSLDKYSTIFGIIFASNYPLCEQFFVEAAKKDRKPLMASAVVVGGIALWWLFCVYPMEKMEYNLTHNYFAFIPLLAYIFFRNITPSVRSVISMSLHTLGKTTLETYLLQHHIWLTSNAKTLLTIIPNNPVLNFAFASMLFYVCSRELYRLTMSLRGMMLPEDASIALSNLKLMGKVFAVLLVEAGVVRVVGLRFGGALAMIGLNYYLFVEKSGSIPHFYGLGQDVRDLPKFAIFKKHAKTTAFILLGAGILCILCGTDSVAVPAPAMSHACMDVCLEHISMGAWDTVSCAGPTVPRRLVSTSAADFEHASNSNEAIIKSSIVKGNDDPLYLNLDGFQMDQYPDDAQLEDYSAYLLSQPTKTNAIMGSTQVWGSQERRRLDMYSVPTGNAAHCEMKIWKWADTSGRPSGDCSCPDGFISRHDLMTLFSKKTIAFVGDSNVRNAYHAFTDEIIEDYDYQSQTSIKEHSNLQQVNTLSGTTIDFLWAPYITNVTAVLSQLQAQDAFPDVTVIGAGLWDVLYTRDLDKIKDDLNHLNKAVKGISKHTIAVWQPPLTVIDSDLRTEEKKSFMTENHVAAMRQAAVDTGLEDSSDFHIIPKSVCQGFTGAGDGVHYQQGTYHVLAQIIANGVKVISPPPPSTTVKPPPKPTGPMSFPMDGFLTVIAALVMLVTMDSFCGIGYLSLRLFGLDLSWERAYNPILEKLGMSTISNDAGAVSGDVELTTPHTDEDSAPLLAESDSNASLDEVNL